MATYGPAHGLTKEQHNLAVRVANDGAELSGRRCAKSHDVTFRSMFETVSNDYAEQTFDGVFREITAMDDDIVAIVNQYPTAKRFETEHGAGPVSRPRSGMSTDLGMYHRTAGRFYACASCSPGSCSLKDYTGSYHLSLTLPMDSSGWIAKDPSILLDHDTCAPSTPENLRNQDQVVETEAEQAEKTRTWINAHTNFANMVQWVEPLLIAVFGSADAHSICDDGRYTEGSFRTMRTGWGVPGTTDVRTFPVEGTGRYVTSGFDWMFPEDMTAVPSDYREQLSGCIKEGMGADIRIKSDFNEGDLRPGESLPPMQVSEGVEIRIFDNFAIEHMPQVYRLIALIAEASRVHDAPEYIYDSQAWAAAMQAIMREGWNAILPAQYVSSLVAALNLPQTFVQHLGSNAQAYHVFSEITIALWDSHSDGMWTELLLDDTSHSALPTFTNPNRESWETSAINAGYTPDKVLHLLGIDDTIDRASLVDIEMRISDLMQEQSVCSEDIEDLVYLADTYGMINNIQLTAQGGIRSFTIAPKSQRNLILESMEFVTPTCSA